MSTVTGSRPTSAPAGSGIPFSRLVAVEFRKAWDTRAGFWLLAVIGLLVVAAEVICLIVFIANDEPDISWGVFTQVAAIVTSLLLPVLGIMLVTAEWTQRTAMVTFALEPRRSRVIGAKLLVGVLLTFATVVLALVVGFICNVLFAATGGSTTWWDQDFANGMLGFVIVQNLTMLVGFALAALFLNTAAAIVVFFAYSYVIPGILAIAANAIGWFEKIEPWINLSTAQAELYNFSTVTGKEWAHFVVATLIWVGIPLTIGLRRILRAEVK